MSSVAESKESDLWAEEFEKMLDEETALIDNLMKPMTETLTRMEPTFAMMKPKKVRETLMDSVKKAGLLVLRFNGLTQRRKIGLFDKLMKWVEKLKKLLEEHGRKVGIDSFSIQVGFPWGVSISFTFKPKS